MSHADAEPRIEPPEPYMPSPRPSPRPDTNELRESHNRYQRRYYARPERVRSRMAARPTPYARRHAAAMCDALDLAPGSHLLELGCGMGRFSRLLAEVGHRVTAVDLSPDLIAELRQAADRSEWGRRVHAVCADSGDLTATLTELPAEHAGPVDAAVGFFFLHHLPKLGPTFESAAAAVRPGGGVAFCEPNADYAPYYAQILLTPGMTWKGERGVARMRRGVVLPALRDAGFRDARLDTYGLFPPFLYDRPLGRRVEALLEHLPGPKAFALFHAARPEAPPAADGSAARRGTP